MLERGLWHGRRDDADEKARADQEGSQSTWVGYEIRRN